MILSRNNLYSRAESLRNLIKLKEAAIKKAPKGSLKISTSHGKVQYYVYNRQKKKKKKYLSLGKSDTIRSLAQKDYDTQVLAAARDELKTLNLLIKKYSKGVAEDIYMEMHPERKKLVIPVLLPDDEYVKQWLDDPYEKPGFSDSDPVIHDENYLRVRSKSEALISNKYYMRQIPSKYEKPLFLEGWGWVNPDFTLLNVRTRKEYIHEHLGMMDDPVYAAKNIAKINAYMRNGYFPGKNLILTFETKDNSFDPGIMDAIIEQYLL